MTSLFRKERTCAIFFLSLHTYMHALFLRLFLDMLSYLVTSSLLLYNRQLRYQVYKGIGIFKQTRQLLLLHRSW